MEVSAASSRLCGLPSWTHVSYSKILFSCSWCAFLRIFCACWFSFSASATSPARPSIICSFCFCSSSARSSAFLSKAATRASVLPTSHSSRICLISSVLATFFAVSPDSDAILGSPPASRSSLTQSAWPKKQERQIGVLANSPRLFGCAPLSRSHLRQSVAPPAAASESSVVPWPSATSTQAWSPKISLARGQFFSRSSVSPS
mmetsp:Transcript_7196/g.24713  ORF Transcript_7196/g.24713 Transcript_7196/m.24713 type:complete len:203 (-) Transcript_7196:173-781(-)